MKIQRKRPTIKSSILFLLFISTVQFSCGQNKVLPANNQQTSSSDTLPATNASNALQHYLHNGDTTFSWTIKNQLSIKGVEVYDILLTSQHWKEYTWKHQLTVIVPNTLATDGALLFITGGHNNPTTEMPKWVNPADNTEALGMGEIAVENKAVVAVLKQVPNEPLFDGKTEDEIISYTLHKYIEDTSDYTWPLLFPMVKSAVRAMDAMQALAKEKLKQPIRRFLVAGASKRGWTTWLTGASGDSRIVAIAPMVIDILNMPVSVPYQLETYGSYSNQIQDYVNLGITDKLSTPGGSALVKMIDPYSYRDKLDMPKMIFMGTNDPYWVIDNVKNYLPGIPGINLLNYTPNAGHDLGGGKVALPALDAFFGITMENGTYPKCSWNTEKEGDKIKLTVEASKDILLGVKIWYANSEDKDFRDETFYSKDLNISHQDEIVYNDSLPNTGYRVFYMELTYQNPRGGSYTVCTRTFMTDKDGIL